MRATSLVKAIRDLNAVGDRVSGLLSLLHERATWQFRTMPFSQSNHAQAVWSVFAEIAIQQLTDHNAAFPTWSSTELAALFGRLGIPSLKTGAGVRGFMKDVEARQETRGNQDASPTNDFHTRK